MYRILFGLLGVVLTMGTLVAKESNAPVSKGRLTVGTIGTTVADFTFKDIDGNRRSLTDFTEAKALVLCFLGVECPLNNLYMQRLRDIAASYADKDVSFLAFYANSHDSLIEVTKHARKFQIPFTVCKDFGNRVADQVAAQRTPEFLILDAQKTLVYRGRIDDQYGFTASGGNFIRPEPTRHDLTMALDEVLAGKTVSVPTTEVWGCRIGRERDATDETITYAEHVAPLIRKHCFECHREGQLAPFTLDSLEEVEGWGAMIREVVRERRMPPWHADPQYGLFRNDRGLSAQEIDTFVRWVDNGMPAGDLKQVPTPPKYSQGWVLGKPDLVYHMPEPFTVPASGTIKYQWITIDPELDEDIWIEGVELKPGNPAVVHHILMFVVPPGVRRPDGRQQSGYFAAFAPGANPRLFPKGLAKKIPAGHKIMFQMHYTANGTEQQDQSYVGLHLAKKPVVNELVTLSVADPRMKLPAGKADVVIRKTHELTQDIDLHAMMPHTHLRGIAFKYEVIYPDGRQEVLLNVPRYDFNWQTAYELEEPKRLSKGTKIVCTAVYDNSANNPNNPDPTVEVKWGPQTWDEMMIGYFDYVSKSGRREPPGGAEGVKRLQTLCETVMAFDKNKDDEVSMDELPSFYQKRAKNFLRAWDKNKDGKLQRTELPWPKD